MKPITIINLTLVGIFVAFAVFLMIYYQFTWDDIPASLIPTSNNHSKINVTFSDQVKIQLQQYYTDNEYMVCMEGTDNNAFYINQLRVYANGTSKEVPYPSICYGTMIGNSLGELHSHPTILGIQTCYPSGEDLANWKFEAQRGLKLFMIQCDKNKIAVYSSINDFKEGVIYEI